MQFSRLWGLDVDQGKELEEREANHLHFLMKWQVILLFPGHYLPAEVDFQILLHTAVCPMKLDIWPIYIYL